MRKMIVVRSQKSVGSSSHKFGGPDNYIAVIEVPDGVMPPKHMRRDSLAKRGIKFHYVGEGYSDHTTSPRSMWRRAMAAAIELCGGEEHYA